MYFVASGNFSILDNLTCLHVPRVGICVQDRLSRQLRLLCLTKKVREVLVITELLTVFQDYDSEPAIIDSFAQYSCSPLR